MYLCICKGVNESQVRSALQDGKYTMGEVRCKTGLGTKCGVCRKGTNQLIQKLKSESTPKTD